MPASQILVVDDEADIRDMVQEILTEEGYQVQVAGSAAEARHARRQAEPDLVLLDIWMPDRTASACSRNGRASNVCRFRW